MPKVIIKATGHYPSLRNVGVILAGTEIDIPDEDFHEYIKHIEAGLMVLVGSPEPTAPSQPQPPPPAPEPSQVTETEPAEEPVVQAQPRKKKRF